MKFIISYLRAWQQTNSRCGPWNACAPRYRNAPILWARQRRNCNRTFRPSSSFTRWLQCI